MRRRALSGMEGQLVPPVPCGRETAAFSASLPDRSLDCQPFLVGRLAGHQALWEPAWRRQLRRAPSSRTAEQLQEEFLRLIC